MAMVESYTVKICQRCGNEYRPVSGHQDYCSECKPIVKKVQCHRWHVAQNKGFSLKTCQQCGQEYLSTGNKQKYCPECKELAYKKGDAMWWKANPAYRATWGKANPEKVHLSKAKRRALKYDNTPISELLTEVQWKTLLAKYDGHCAYCGKEAKLTLDHVIPLIQGGKHSIENVVPACIHCNCSKQARTPEQWLQSLITGGGSDASKSVREQSLVLEGD